MTRRQGATDAEVEAALQALDGLPQRERASTWPADPRGLDSPGLYSWWVDGVGAADLSNGLGHTVNAGRIYAGLTGATKWPSGTTGKATLRSRIRSQHIGGRIRGSTFRLTLAAALRDTLDLTVTGPKALSPESERRLSAWIANHLEVAVHPFPDPDALADLEHRVLARLDPPLNLDGVQPTPIRLRLAQLRAALA